MFDSEFSIGSYKIKVKMLLAFLFFLCIILCHTLCSCCYVNLREGLDSILKPCEEKISNSEKKRRRKQLVDNENQLIKQANDAKKIAVVQINDTVDFLNNNDIPNIPNIKSAIINYQSKIHAFSKAENSDRQKVTDIQYASGEMFGAFQKDKDVDKESSNFKTLMLKFQDSDKKMKEAKKATAAAAEATILANTCRKSTSTTSKEGFTNSSYSDKNASTFILDPSTWGNRGSITASGSSAINTNSSSSILNVFNEMKFAPECCPNAYTSSNGCACMDKNMYKYLQNRGGNNVPFSQY
jgi:hypothetical protein